MQTDDTTIGQYSASTIYIWIAISSFSQFVFIVFGNFCTTAFVWSDPDKILVYIPKSLTSDYMFI